MIKPAMLVLTSLLLMLATSCVSAEPLVRPAADRPNFVIIFLDDSGWGDFRPFGQTKYPTPHVERLASEGCRFDNFYVPQAICSASRSALMTGCYPGRTCWTGRTE